MKNNNSIGFFGALQIAFIILKVCKVIKCNWFFVFTPFYVWLLLVIILTIVTIKLNR